MPRNQDPESTEERLNRLNQLTRELAQLTKEAQAMAVQISDILSQLSTLKANVDAYIALSTPANLQPISDAITAIQADVTAASVAASGVPASGAAQVVSAG